MYRPLSRWTGSIPWRDSNPYQKRVINDRERTSVRSYGGSFSRCVHSGTRDGSKISNSTQLFSFFKMSSLIYLYSKCDERVSKLFSKISFQGLYFWWKLIKLWKKFCCKKWSKVKEPFFEVHIKWLPLFGLRRMNKLVIHQNSLL